MLPTFGEHFYFNYTMKKRLSIKEWSKDERPREKLMEKGAESLSDAELIAILVACGTKEESALVQEIFYLSAKTILESSLE